MTLRVNAKKVDRFRSFKIRSIRRIWVWPSNKLFLVSKKRKSFVKGKTVWRVSAVSGKRKKIEKDYAEVKGEGLREIKGKDYAMNHKKVMWGYERRLREVSRGYRRLREVTGEGYLRLCNTFGPHGRTNRQTSKRF